MRARSSMERLALEAGARLVRFEGWNVANAYDTPAPELRRLTQTVGYVDRSSLIKLELQAEPATLAAIVAKASDGVKLEPGLAGRSPGSWWCPVTPARVLVLSEAGHGEAVRAAVARAAEEAENAVTVVDLTCGLAALSLIGPSARELLARFCAIDVRPAVTPRTGFRPGSIARTPGYLLVEGKKRLLVLVGWALGEYLWRVVADAAEHLGGGPVGAEALAHHLELSDA
jgi:heterotetrameric sarcosine oxidase gamma subunit